MPGQQWGAHDFRDLSEESTNSDDGYSSNEWSASECNMFALNRRKRELEGGREGGREREVHRCPTNARKKIDTNKNTRGVGRDMNMYVCVCVCACV